MVPVEAVKIWLMGGLGNQLFQVNYGLKLLEENRAPIIFNTYLTRKNLFTSLLGWTIHDYFLERLIDVDPNIIYQSDPLAIAASKLPFKQNYSAYFGLEQVPLSPPRNIFGYFQNAEFLSKDTPTFRLKSGLLSKHPVFDTVMHLRGGDINDFNYADSYYCKLLAELETSVIHVVTNNLQYFTELRQKFPRHTFMDVSEHGYFDFLTCCNAKRLLVAPSTFSWWAARLGGPSEIVLPERTYRQLGKPCLNSQVSHTIL